MTLIEAIVEVLRKNANKPTSVQEIAEEINGRTLFHKTIDGSYVAFGAKNYLDKLHIMISARS